MTSPSLVRDAQRCTTLNIQDKYSRIVQSLYTLAKLVKSSEEGALNENLLTGALAWTSERSKILLGEILYESHSMSSDHEPDSVDRFLKELGSITDCDIHIDSSASISGDVGRFDLLFGGDTVILAIENKVVPIGSPNCLNHKQIERYCRGLAKTHSDKEILMLCITPDKENLAMEEIGRLPPSLMDGVRWISWKEIWHIVQKLTESEAFPESENVILTELSEGIRMANLEPFEGFTSEEIEIASRVRELKKVVQFFDSVEHTLTRPKGLNLIGEKKPRHNAPSHAYVKYTYRLFWDRTWKNRTHPHACYCVDLRFRKTPDIGTLIWFPTGVAMRQFREISPLCDDIARKLAHRFAENDVKAGLYRGTESDFYVRIPLASEISSHPEQLLEYIEEVISFYRDEIVPALKELGYVF